MINLLARIFIKNRADYSNPFVRQQYGTLCGVFGIFLNVVLFGLKLIFGILASSVAMIADAFNNISDAAASLVSILGFKLSSKKPDIEHPFGHGRLEYISGLIISFLILFMGLELLNFSSWDSTFLHLTTYHSRREINPHRNSKRGEILPEESHWVCCE